MAQRVIITVGWLTAAVLAVLVGLVAIRLIGAGITTPGTEPMSQSQVEQMLQDQPPPTTPPSSSPPSPSASESGDQNDGSKLTPGGTVVARCTAGEVEIVSMSPAIGWEVHDRDTGLDDNAEGEFRRISDNQDRIKVDVLCGASGEPRFSVRSERDDDD